MALAGESASTHAHAGIAPMDVVLCDNMERLCKNPLCKSDTKKHLPGPSFSSLSRNPEGRIRVARKKKENKRRNQIKTPANRTNPEQTIQMLPGTWRRADGLPETERQKQENKQEVFSIKKFLISRGPLRGPERKKPEEKAEPAQSRAEMMQMVVNFGRKSHPSRSFRATVTLK